MGYEFEQRAARLTDDLQSGRREDASHILRDELMFRPNEAVALINEATSNAGPNARERIVVEQDGDVILSDPYGRQRVGQLQPEYQPPINPGYAQGDVPPPPPPPSDGSQVAEGIAIGAIGGLILGSILHGDHRRPDDGRHRR